MADSRGSAEDTGPVLSEGPGTLVATGRKARYGVAYLRSVCSQAGMPMAENSPDEDVLATDCTVSFAEAPVFVQVKCTSTSTMTGKRVSVRLKQEWCDKWARCRLPVYLAVVVVPEDVSGWLAHRTTGTFHAAAAYWVRVDGVHAKSVSVPKSQRLEATTFTQWHAELLASFGATA